MAPRLPATGVPTPALTVRAGRIWAKSTDVAAFFGKRHDNVLQSIENLDVPADFTDLNFQVSEYLDASGKANKSYEMTRDGFTIVAFGFTGANAMAFKLAYIQGFNAMEQALYGPPDPSMIGPLPAKKLSTGERKEIGQLLHRKVANAVRYFEKSSIQGMSRMLCERFGVKYYGNIRPDDLVEALERLDEIDPIDAFNMWVGRQEQGEG